MNRFNLIIYFLLVILFLVCFYFFGKEQRIFEGAVESGLDLADKTVFGQNVDKLKANNKLLEKSLDKINKTYTDLNNNKNQLNILETTIKEKMDEVNVINQKIADEYKLITNSVQPIMYLKMNIPTIFNAAITENIIDTKINDILKTTSYNIVKSNNASVTTDKGKKCLRLNGIITDGIFFSVIPTLNQFSFSFWIYNDNMNQDDPVISIMNPFDFDKKIINSGLQVLIKNNQVEFRYNNTILTNPSIHNGWNHITFTTGDTNACIYIDGGNIKASAYKAAPISPLPDSYETLYRLNTYFCIGGTSFRGYIYNVRYYAIEIPPKVVKDVYKLDVTNNANSG